MQGPYADHILDASDVCSNCLRLVRVERIDPHRTDGLEAASKLERHRERTEIGYGPARSPADSKGVFCSCGCEGVFTRAWGDDIGRERFTELVKQLIKTLDEKDVDVREKTVAGVALQEFRERGGDGPVPFDADDVDEALASAVEAGIAAATSGGADCGVERGAEA